MVIAKKNRYVNTLQIYMVCFGYTNIFISFYTCSIFMRRFLPKKQRIRKKLQFSSHVSREKDDNRRKEVRIIANPMTLTYCPTLCCLFISYG